MGKNLGQEPLERWTESIAALIILATAQEVFLFLGKPVLLGVVHSSQIHDVDRLNAELRLQENKTVRMVPVKVDVVRT